MISRMTCAAALLVVWLSGIVVADDLVTRLRFSASNDAAAGHRDAALIAGRAGAAPKIDGVVGDDEWAAAGAATIANDVAPTRVLALHDSSHLHFAFDCVEPAIDRIRRVREPNPKGDADAYEDDSIELFVFVGPRRYQFILNTRDARYDACDQDNRHQPEWSGRWSGKTRVGPGRWQAEFSIDRESIGALDTLTPFRVGFVRNRYVEDTQYLMWQDEGRSEAGSRPLVLASTAAVAIRDVSVGDASIGAQHLSAELINLAGDASQVAAAVTIDGTSSQREIALPPNQPARINVPFHYQQAGPTQLDIVLTQGLEKAALARWRHASQVRSPINAWLERFRYHPADGAATVFFDLDLTEENLARCEVIAQHGTRMVARAAPTGRQGELTVDLRELPAGEHVVGLRLLGAEGTELAVTPPLALTLSAAALPAASGEIPLRIDLPPAARGITGPVPVVVGVPLANGTLASDQHLSLVDGEGNAVALEARAAQFWSRHHRWIKWLHVHFQVDGNDHGKTYTLRYGPDARPLPPPVPLRVTQEPARISIDTRAMQFVVRCDRFNLIDSLHCGGREVIVPGEGNGLTVIDRQGRTFRSARGGADSVVVEHAGGMHAIIRAEGWLVSDQDQRKTRYIVRLFAYAGLPLLRVEHTFINTEDYDEAYREVSMRMQLAAAGATRTLSTAFCDTPEDTMRAAAVNVGSAGSTVLLQSDWEAFRLGVVDASGSWRALHAAAAHADGSMHLADERQAMAVAVQDWRENFPKGYEVAGDVVKLHLWPPHVSRPLAFHPREYLAPALVEKLAYDTRGTHFDAFTYADDMRDHPPIGAGKSHEFLIDFGSPTPARAAQLQALVDEPALAVLPPQWYVDSDVFGRISVRDPQRFPVVERAFDAMFEQLAFRQHEARDYGFMNFGSNKHQFMNRQPGNWVVYRMYAGMGYGLPNQPWLLYARSGDRKYLREANRMTRHVMDFSVCHHGPRTGCHGRLSPVHWKYNAVLGPGLHGETQCLMRRWYMTGCRRALDVLEEMRRVARLQPRRSGSLTERSDVDPQKNLIDHYELTWDRKFLELQRMLFEGVAAGRADWEPSYGHYYAKMLPVVHAYTGDPRALQLAISLLRDPVLGGAGYGTNRREQLAAYVYHATGDPQWIDAVGGEAHMNEVCSRVETTKPLPQRGILYYENPRKPGEMVPDNFICMWMDKLIWKYTYLMAAIRDAETRSADR